MSGSSDDDNDNVGMPIASPSFILTGTAGRAFPRGAELGNAGELHEVEEVKMLFPDLKPGETKFVALIEKLLKDDCTIDNVCDTQTILNLCREARQVLEVEASLIQIQVSKERSVAIVGDVHGQFGDLVHHILPQQAPGRTFLFMGDYVDRGPQGLEAVILLLAMKVTFPSHVYLLRGNHEDAQTSRIYGFHTECCQKLGQQHGVDVWSAINDVFCRLPIAALLTGANEKRYFCAHGGLSPELENVMAVADIERLDYGATLDNTSSSIMDGLLWSDPAPESNVMRFRPNERGCGYAFGVVATREFCQNNNIALVIRAHQMAMEGYMWSHNDACLTVFSAPNYCGVSNNLGAVVVADDQLDLKFIQYRQAPAKGHVGAPAPMSLPPFFFR